MRGQSLGLVSSADDPPTFFFTWWEDHHTPHMISHEDLTLSNKDIYTCKITFFYTCKLQGLTFLNGFKVQDEDLKLFNEDNLHL